MTRAAWLACLLLTACAPDETPSEIEISGDEKADSVVELRVRAAETTLWVDRSVGWNGTRFVMRGRSSRDVVDGQGYIFDDIYGEFAAVGPRSFTLSWGSDVRGLVEGVDQLIGLQLPDRSITGRAVVGPRLTGYSGSGVTLVGELKPVISGGRVVYRTVATASSKIFWVGVDAAGVALTDWKLVDDTHVQIDLLEDHVLALAKSGGTLTVQVNLETGMRAKHAHLELALRKLGITDQDAYEKWPPVTCTPSVKACLQALPAGTTDLGSCGLARPVRACMGQVGAIVDDVAVQAALKALDARLADPAGLAADADALAGADKRDALIEAARMYTEGRLEQMAGRWYLDATARDAALVAESDAAFDVVYARPFDLIEPHTPVPGDLATERQIAADALLAYLGTQDLTRTEWERSFETLAHQYRAQHVASLRAFRETATTTPYMTGIDLFTGDWLGAYVEISISIATGAATHVLLEID
jgi:hypothetical protein